MGQAPYHPAPPYGYQMAGGPLVDRDAEHLRLLSIGHYVVGAVLGLMACIPIIHLVVGIGIAVAGSASPNPEAPPVFFGLLFAAIAATIILAGWTVAGSTIAAGRFLTQRRRHTFCMVVACVLCLFMPLGAILGVFSLIVLNRASVKAMFR
jgi:hypothetical protein